MWQSIRWSGRIASATRGKRGQVFFRELVSALDTMPAKRLVDGALQTSEGDVCALGALGRAKGVKLDELDTTNWDALGETFNIAASLSREVMYMNDDFYGGTPERRWEMVRKWAASQIVPTAEELESTRAETETT
jgi:hypothetical protein